MVHEDPSTEATQKLPKERMFRKKSNEQLSKNMLTVGVELWLPGARTARIRSRVRPVVVFSRN
ncbi:MAG: hypothetical protein LBJ16_04255 [Holosporaceae bacterium]|nr:hypothetical protein [Holosporaceae bacterium]